MRWLTATSCLMGTVAVHAGWRGQVGLSLVWAAQAAVSAVCHAHFLDPMAFRGGWLVLAIDRALARILWMHAALSLRRLGHAPFFARAVAFSLAYVAISYFAVIRRFAPECYVPPQHPPAIAVHGSMHLMAILGFHALLAGGARCPKGPLLGPPSQGFGMSERSDRSYAPHASTRPRTAVLAKS